MGGDGAGRIEGERWATGLPLSGHPLAIRRAALVRRGVLPAAALAGRRVAVAGQLVVLQRPPTANGVVFASLEDDSGLANLVLSPDVYRRCRATLHAAPLLLATGRIQRRGAVAHVMVTDVAPCRPDQG